MKQLRLVTYNIHKGIGVDHQYHLDRIIKICKNTKADFIALQEVSSHFPRSQNDPMAEILSQELNMFYKLGLNVNLRKGAYGNASLSRHPILTSQNYDISLHFKKKRSCLATQIQFFGENLLILNIHLGLANFERRRQMQKIIEYAQQNKFQNMPLILMGDTNDHGHKLTSIIQKAGLRDIVTEKPLNDTNESLLSETDREEINSKHRVLYKKMGLKLMKKKKKRMYTFPSYAPILRLDKAFVSPHWTIQEQYVIEDQLTRISSDHLPLYMELSLKEKN